jgi:integrase
MPRDPRIHADTYRDGRPRYTIRFREPGGGKHIRETFSRYVDAVARLDEVSAAKRTGSYTPKAAGRQTLQSLFDEVHAARPYARATLSLHATAWRRILSVDPHFGTRRIATISPEEIDRLVAKIEAPAMAAKTRELLRAMFSFAIAARPPRLTNNPAKKAHAPATRAERMQAAGGKLDERQYLTVGELARLLAEVPERYETLITVMARLGLRPGEAYASTVEKFDPLKRTLLIDTSITGFTKTGLARTIALPAIVGEQLGSHIERWSSWTPGALIFPTEGGTMINPANFRDRIFRPAVERAGLPAGFSPNLLRHSAVAYAIAHGADVYSVSRLVGHAKPSITLDVYGSLWDTSAEQLAARLDTAIRGETPATEGEVVAIDAAREARSDG